jgi:hypothetical protein
MKMTSMFTHGFRLEVAQDVLGALLAHWAESAGYPNGYVNYSNSSGQSINPYSGQTVAPSSPW